MAYEVSPQYFADTYLEEVGSAEVRITSGKTLTVYDNGFKIVDEGDATKVAQFQASGLTAATTRTITLPDYSFTLGSNKGARRSILASSGNTTMTSAMSGSVMLLDGATVAYTLPSIGSSNDVGMQFDFVTTVAATGASITAGAGNKLLGAVDIVDFDTANTATPFFPNGSSHLVISLNGTTKGGKVGSWLRLIALSASNWYVTGTLYGDGVLVTPFS